MCKQPSDWVLFGDIVFTVGNFTQDYGVMLKLFGSDLIDLIF